jgi:hypothetical protein
MTDYHRMPPPRLYLYRLTLQVRGEPSNAYSLGESVEDAFSRYLDRAIKQKLVPADIEFVQGDLADPNARRDQ